MSLWRTTLLAFLLLVTPVDAQDAILDQIRSDVRAAPAVAPAPAPLGDAAAPQDDRKGEPDKYRNFQPSEFGREEDSDSRKDDEHLGFGGLLLGLATAPLWAPHFAIGDNLMDPLSFQAFPYESDDGRMLGGELLTGEPKTFSWQWRSEYIHQSPNVHIIGGRLLLEGASRMGISTEFGRLSELRPNGRADELWLGNCNFLLRFAQSERMQWRTGIGANWMADHGTGSAGLNFTYGFDYFPCRPLVAAVELDWGQLGSTELFRFRTTGGVVWRRLEAYTGYEHLDIGRTSLNGVIGGVRLWF